MQSKNKNISYLKECKICGNTKLKEVLQLNEQYISATFVKSNINNKLTEIKTPLTLVLCQKEKNKNNCGLLQLSEITEPDLLYREYFYRSATSDTMRVDLNDVVNEVTNIVKPNPKDIVVDIGSNDCTLLNFYENNLRLVGYEPAKNIKYIDKGKNIKIFSNYFNANDYHENFKEKAKIITSCAMFYDLADPKKFVGDIESILEDEGVWCVQISYLASMIKYNNFYDICHEHLSYYSIDSFNHLLNNFNLKCFYAQTNAVNGGSIRLFVCKKNCNKYINSKYTQILKELIEEEKKYNLKDEQTFLNYQKKIDEIKNKTNFFVNEIINSKKQVFGLGASTKGNILLQHFGLDKNKIPYISERNQEKVGLRCLGSDIELISEDEARLKNPKAFLVLPWNFKTEIVKREQNFINSGGELMFPMPYPHVVSKKGETKL
ncbi:MAG: methyltransferase domain-containing protein [Pelagibacteraceae bacterium]